MRIQINSIILLLSIAHWLINPAFALAQLEVPSLLQAVKLNQQQNLVSLIMANEFILDWSTNTYTPFAYPGKPLPTYESPVYVSLIPLVQPKINLSNLIYKWYLDDIYQSYASGKNRQDFVFRTSLAAGAWHFVSLKIENEDGNVLLNLTTNIPIVSAGIVLYPQNQAPTQASLTVSEATFLKPGEEQGFVALPFFINVTKPTDLDYRWSFEGQSVFKTDKSNQFSVKVAQGDLQESFSRELAVYVENPFNRIQSASGRIEIIVKK